MRQQRHVLAALTLAVTVTTAVTACADQTTPSGPDPSPGLPGTSWSVESVTVDGKTLTAPAAARLAIGAEAPYEATGNYGCNGLSAKVEIKGSTMNVQPGSRTAMACPDIKFETAFAKLFKGALTIESRPEHLTLKTADGNTISLTTKPRTPDAPLTATDWSADSLIQGATVSSVPAEVAGKARFTIAADGAASGNLGCNRFSARAVVDGSRITFGPLTSTRMACTGPAGDVERALTALFAGGPLEHRVQGDTLTLTATDGSGKGLGAKAASAVE
ncbi:hypothetical protein ADK55_18910 [Streptomyces sp. WM4235]|uniref:META domain-containing protein n=1 Tax=Streptomyces sp. WM4235 TaxID=1415551 RepID=UPI0006AE01CE|nr:META domain-containing protein [Streptomyces sp. WM4235]KOU49688.1 hypothetical protein ADK55_18910 [Streptomyces sp. WM4235]